MAQTLSSRWSLIDLHGRLYDLITSADVPCGERVDGRDLLWEIVVAASVFDDQHGVIGCVIAPGTPAKVIGLSTGDHADDGLREATRRRAVRRMARRSGVRGGDRVEV